MSLAEPGEALRCDLHAHSNVSDGTLTPRELVDAAREAGVSALALTDHDTLDGLAPALERAREVGIELLPGIEISVGEAGGSRQMHLLGLGVDPDDASLRAWSRQRVAERQTRVATIVEHLQRAGVDISFEQVRSRDPEAALGRPHVARVLVELGACRHHEDAFDRFLRRGRPAYVPRLGPSSRQAIDAIHGAGGIAVLAHPPLSLGVDDAGGIDAFVARLVESGLDGLEVDHPGHTRRQRRRLRRLCREHDLIATGGSDFHGASRPDVELGRGRHGNVKLPMTVYEAVRERVEGLRGRRAAV